MHNLTTLYNTLQHFTTHYTSLQHAQLRNTLQNFFFYKTITNKLYQTTSKQTNKLYNTWNTATHIYNILQHVQHLTKLHKNSTTLFFKKKLYTVVQQHVLHWTKVVHNFSNYKILQNLTKLYTTSQKVHTTLHNLSTLYNT